MRITRVVISGWDSLNSGQVDLSGDGSFATFRLNQEQVDILAEVVRKLLPGMYDTARKGLDEAKAQALALPNEVQT